MGCVLCLRLFSWSSCRLCVVSGALQPLMELLGWALFLVMEFLPRLSIVGGTSALHEHPAWRKGVDVYEVAVYNPYFDLALIVPYALPVGGPCLLLTCVYRRLKGLGRVPRRQAQHKDDCHQV